MAVDRTTQRLLGQHYAAGTKSPFTGPEARIHSGENDGIIPAPLIDAVMEETVSMPDILEIPAKTTPSVRARVADALRGIGLRKAS